ncbi:hypothetical protein FRC10_008419 [Ceratobasidium sp. 414]|nr:hypothetical protein FRC10_008419 [Ceratobasidium sp. 414]
MPGPGLAFILQINRQYRIGIQDALPVGIYFRQPPVPKRLRSFRLRAQSQWSMIADNIELEEEDDAMDPEL